MRPPSDLISSDAGLPEHPIKEIFCIEIKLIHELERDETLLVDFELDRRIPFALGGTPSDLRNLELQPWDEAGEKDAIEGCLARAVCAGKIGLDDARRSVWTAGETQERRARE